MQVTLDLDALYTRPKVTRIIYVRSCRSQNAFPELQRDHKSQSINTWHIRIKPSKQILNKPKWDAR